MEINQSQKNNSENWQLRKLDSMFTVRRGGSPRPIENYITNREDGLNWLKIGDIDVGAKYITSTSSKILKEGLSRTTLVKKGDFILSNSMSFGRPYIMNIDACIHDGWLTFQDIKTDILDRDFLYYLLSQSKTQSIFVSISAGSGVQNLKKETVAEVELPIPTLPEQKRIVSILETWDKSIEKLTHKIEVKKQIKRGLMQDLLTGKKRLIGFKDKWRTSEFNELFEVLKKPNGLKSDNYQERGTYPIVDQSKDVLISGYTDDKSYLCGFSNKPAVVFGDHSRVIKYVDFDTSFGNDGIKIFQAKNNLNIRFGYYILSNFRVPETGYNRHFKYIEAGIFDIPSIKEQCEIEKILSTADKEITELEKKLSILKEQKRYLLNNLITGTIRTPETLSTKLTK